MEEGLRVRFQSAGTKARGIGQPGRKLCPAQICSSVWMLCMTPYRRYKPHPSISLLGQSINNSYLGVVLVMESETVARPSNTSSTLNRNRDEVGAELQPSSLLNKHPNMNSKAPSPPSRLISQSIEVVIARL